jgi:hypothetical protein
VLDAKIRSNLQKGEKMKKAILILSFLVFASPAWAIIYKWTDQKGTTNFTDNQDNVPPGYRDSAQEINIPKMQTPTLSQASVGKTMANTQSGGTGTQPPPIAQALIPEGDFAIKLAEALKVGRAQNEAEAESILASAGIAPKNGWIADYPVTPDIIGELQNSIGVAADSGKLPVNKDVALKALENLTAGQGLPVAADAESQVIEAEPSPNDVEYSNPEVINNYYYDQGPPVVTYYPPPPDYGYLYSWVPYPFWCSGFRFGGFFILNDFHRSAFVNGRRVTVSNHFVDPKTRRVFPIDPRTRSIGKSLVTTVSQTGRVASTEAQKGAASIMERSQERARSRSSVTAGIKTGSGAPVIPQRRSDLSTFKGRLAPLRPPTTSHWMGRSQAEIGSKNPSGSSFSQRGGNNSGGGMTVSRLSSSSMNGRSLGGSRGGSGFGSRGYSGGGGHR